jgi:hypothetical protein
MVDFLGGDFCNILEKLAPRPVEVKRKADAGGGRQG